MLIASGGGVPWWGAGLFAVAGILLGQLGSMISDIRKDRRALALRHDDELLKHYADYLEVVASLFTVHSYDPTFRPTLKRLALSHNVLIFSAPLEVGKLSVALLEAFRNLADASSPQEMTSRRAQVLGAANEFLQAARKHRGLDFAKDPKSLARDQLLPSVDP